MKKIFSNVSIELRQGDIANQADCEAVINAANSRLESGGGVAGAIHTAAGPGLAKEAKPLAPIKPGEAVITGGHDLPNKYVIHCLGPVYGKDKPEAELLSNCYKNALDLADKHQLSSVAFPAISTGIFGYPVEEAAKVAFSAINEKAADLQNVNHIVLVLYSSKDLQIHERILEQMKQGKDYPG